MHPIAARRIWTAFMITKRWLLVVAFWTPAVLRTPARK
jgi:hypothetical protein